MSTINATNIKNAASSVTNITLDTNGGITSAGTVTVNNPDSSSNSGNGANIYTDSNQDSSN